MKATRKEMCDNAAQISRAISKSITEILLQYEPEPMIATTALLDATNRILIALGEATGNNPDEYAAKCLNIALRAICELPQTAKQ